MSHRRSSSQSLRELQRRALSPKRVLGKQRVDSVYEDCRCASQKDDRLRSFGEPESSLSRVAPMVAIVQIDP
jgi:hypothetical protein